MRHLLRELGPFRYILSGYTIAITALIAIVWPTPANAILTYSIFQQGGDVRLDASGSLELPGVAFDTGPFSTCSITIYNKPCYPFIDVARGSLGTYSGPIGSTDSTQSSYAYLLSGPTSFGLGVGAGTVSGEYLSGARTLLCGGCNFRVPTIALEQGIGSGDTITSSVIFRNTTLAALGLYSEGLVGEWTLQPHDGSDPYTAFDKVRVVVSSGGSSGVDVPAPLGFLGVLSAFHWSRKLRKRVEARK